jgi:hypothetical protein
MPPLWWLLTVVCVVNILLYGILGLLLGGIGELFWSSGHPDPVIIKKADE